MTVTTVMNEKTCTLAVEGDIDTVTSPELEKAVLENAPKCDKLIIDFAGVEYISSAGIRAVLRGRKLMGADGFTVKNVTNNVMEIFRLTGFDMMLNIE